MELQGRVVALEWCLCSKCFELTVQQARLSMLQGDPQCAGYAYNFPLPEPERTTGLRLFLLAFLAFCYPTRTMATLCYCSRCFCYGSWNLQLGVDSTHRIMALSSRNVQLRCSIYGTVRTKIPMEMPTWSFQAPLTRHDELTHGSWGLPFDELPEGGHGPLGCHYRSFAGDDRRAPWH